MLLLLVALIGAADRLIDGFSYVIGLGVFYFTCEIFVS
jgi:hypothetical protein